MLSRTTNDQDLVRVAQRIQLMMTYLLLPMLTLIAVGGEALIALLFGPSWVAAGPVLQVLAIGGVFQVLGYVHYWLFIQKNRLAILWYFELATWSVIVPTYFIVGSRGMVAIALLYACGLVCNWALVGRFGIPRAARPSLCCPTTAVLLSFVHVCAGNFIGHGGTGIAIARWC